MQVSVDEHRDDFAHANCTLLPATRAADHAPARSRRIVSPSVSRRRSPRQSRLHGRLECHAVVALGGNVGDVPAAFVRALGLLETAHTRVTRVSRLYHSVALNLPGPLTQAAPTPDGDFDHFTNAACRLVTLLGPRQLLQCLQRIEHLLGRQRGSPWGPRTIDLDLICYEQKIMNHKKLTLPHKGLPFRAFVLAPCQDIGVEFPWPHLPTSVSELLSGRHDAARGLLHRQLSWRLS